jgi:hypothetical protein
VIEDEVLLEMLDTQPRLRAMLQWRLALNADLTPDEVVTTFRDDWNRVQDLIKRVSPPKGDTAV